jgi:hypothetical protein
MFKEFDQAYYQNLADVDALQKDLIVSKRAIYQTIKILKNMYSTFPVHI